MVLQLRIVPTHKFLVGTLGPRSILGLRLPRLQRWQVAESLLDGNIRTTPVGAMGRSRPQNWEAVSGPKKEKSLSHLGHPKVRRIQHPMLDPITVRGTSNCLLD